MKEIKASFTEEELEQINSMMMDMITNIKTFKELLQLLTEKVSYMDKILINHKEHIEDLETIVYKVDKTKLGKEYVQ